MRTFDLFDLKEFYMQLYLHPGDSQMSALLSSMKTPPACRLAFPEASQSCHCCCPGACVFAGKPRAEVGKAGRWYEIPRCPSRSAASCTSSPRVRAPNTAAGVSSSSPKAKNAQVALQKAFPSLPRYLPCMPQAVQISSSKYPAVLCDS